MQCECGSFLFLSISLSLGRSLPQKFFRILSLLFASLIPIRVERNLNLNHRHFELYVWCLVLWLQLFGQVDLLIKSLASISNLIAQPFLPCVHIHTFTFCTVHINPNTTLHKSISGCVWCVRSDYSLFSNVEFCILRP